MVSAIASRKYERAALSRLFRFTLAIQPRVQAEHRSDREVTMWSARAEVRQRCRATARQAEEEENLARGLAI